MTLIYKLDLDILIAGDLPPYQKWTF